jgi:signal transduction histidine kinase
MAMMTSPPIKGQLLLDHACNATPAVAGKVRLMIDRRIPEWGVPAPPYSEVRENLALVITELVNNAVAETPDREIRIRCSRDFTARTIWVGVWDSSDRNPKVALPDLTPETLDLRAENFDDNGGWGLPLVRALSTSCGVEPTSGGGKWVWANISVDSDNER